MADEPLKSLRPGRFKAAWGNISLEGSGTAFLLVVAFAAAGGGGYATGRYLKPESAVEAQIRTDLDQIATRLDNIDRKLDALRDSAVEDREKVLALRQVVAHNDAVFSATIEELRPGSKLPWAAGKPPEKVDFHAQPLNKKAPAVQPKAALLSP